MTPVRLEPAALRSRVKHSTTEPLRSQITRSVKRHRFYRLTEILSFYALLRPGNAGPRSAVGKVSGYRCVSDCISRVASLIPVRSHTFVEIDHEMISTVILLPSADSFKKDGKKMVDRVDVDFAPP